MDGAANFSNYDLEDIVSPVKVDKLQELLIETGYDQQKMEFLVDGFSNGFSLGYEGPEEIQLTAPNLKFVIGNKTEMWNKIMKEVEAKRYAGPFEEIPFKNYIQSPIGLVPKDGGKKTGLIFHLSFPKNGNTSVNANTNPELCHVKYKDFDQAIKICIQEGVYVYLGKSDISHAFRNIPLKKKYWKYLIMKAESPKDGKIYYFVDKCLPFGASISCAIFQAVSDALAHIVKMKTNKDNINYLDDFLFIALLEGYCNHQLDIFLKVCNEVNLPVAEEKTCWATQLIQFLGLLIDAKRGMICIPLDKIKRATELILHLKNKKKGELREIQRLCGYLNFLNKCIVPRRAFTRRMYSVGSHLTKPHHHFNVTQELKLDLEMWLAFLSQPEAYNRSFFDFDSKQFFSPLDFFTDASGTKGAGGYCDQQWFIIEWDSEFLLEAKPSINYLELFALTVAVLSWAKDFKNRNIIVFCDNQSVIHMVNNSTSGCKNCMVLIRFLVMHCLLFNIRLKVKYVQSKENTFADLLSRLKYKEFRSEARKQRRRFQAKPIDIPQQLWPMSKIWLF